MNEFKVGGRVTMRDNPSLYSAGTITGICIQRACYRISWDNRDIERHIASWWIESIDE